MKNISILFCLNTLDSKSVDLDYIAEYQEAKKLDFNILFLDFDLIDDIEKATRKINANLIPQKVIYRGWMLNANQYQSLYNQLLKLNYQLINTPTEYLNCHYLPNSLKFISNYTPKTIFQKFEDEQSLDHLIEKSKVFGSNAVIIKDYVKSEKHYWETACFVNNASNEEKLRNSIDNFLVLRGNFLNEGIVIREFIELEDLTIHSKSGMPLKLEYRLFFLNQKLLGIYNYWEEGDYQIFNPDISLFEEIANKIESVFFTMDIAKMKNGSYVIIELGDGQVSGLPENINIFDFYDKILNFIL